MTDIVIIDNDNALSEYAVRVLSKSYYIRYFDENMLTEISSGYMLNIVRCKKISRINCESCIVLLGENEVYSDIKSENGIYIITNSFCTHQIKSLSECAYPVMTCGGYSKDTVSFTSLTDDNITVSLNRTVTALSGRIIPPLEFPVKREKNVGLYQTLAVTAVRILLDDFDSELGRLY